MLAISQSVNSKVSFQKCSVIRAPVSSSSARQQGIVRASNSEDGGTVIVKRAQEISSEALGKASAAWDNTEDKPAAIVLAVAAFLVLYASNAVVSSLDSIPLISDLFKIIGLIVTVWFTQKYVLPVDGRKDLYENINSFVKEITGSS